MLADKVLADCPLHALLHALIIMCSVVLDEWHFAKLHNRAIKAQAVRSSLAC